MFNVYLVLANGAQYNERIEATSKVDAATKLAQAKGYGKSDIYRANVNGESVCFA